MNTKNPQILPITGRTSDILKLLATRHSRKLFVTFFFVIAENVIFLLYPVLAGIAINAMINGETITAAMYGLMVLFIWFIGAVRRSIDTRTFARIYAGLAVSVILAQRSLKLNHSVIAARVTLSREFVNFFEIHLPMLVTSAISLFGATFMLLMIEVRAGIICILILLFLMCFVPGYARKNEKLFRRVNNRLEKEVDYIHTASLVALNRHYSTLARLRIRLSDREALGYLTTGGLIALLFSLTIIDLSFSGGIDAGHIYAVMTYMWMFAMSLDDAPQLLKQFSQLRDIGKRMMIRE